MFCYVLGYVLCVAQGWGDTVLRWEGTAKVGGNFCVAG